MADYSSKAGRTIELSIRRIRGIKKWNTSHVFIQCPFHPNDKTPSCSINLDGTSGVPVGWNYCFGCSHSSHWNVLAEKLGLDKIRGGDFKKDRITDSVLENTKHDLLGVTNHTLESLAEREGYGFTIPYPSHKMWRQIPGSLLHDLGAKITFDPGNDDTAVLLPVTVKGKVRGLIKASRVKQERSYINSDGAWVKSYGLFPLDHMITLEMWKEYRSIVLVEGPRDALRLIRYGIPAVAILGSQSWSERKRNLVLSLSPAKIILMFDGDRAGIQASNTVRRDLLPFMKPKVVRLAPLAEELGRKVDPGNCPKSVLRDLRDLIQA